MNEEIIVLVGLMVGICVAITGLFNIRAILTRVFALFLLFAFMWLVAHFVLFTIQYLPLLVIMVSAAFGVGYLAGLIITYLYRYFKIKKYN